MFFENDDFAIVDEQGNICGFVDFQDVTDDGIADVAHVTQLDGTGTYVSLDETETDSSIQESFAEIDGMSGFSGGELSHHMEPGQVKTSYSQMFEAESDSVEITQDLFAVSNVDDNLFDNIGGENLFENEVQNYSANISFTGLADGGLVNSDTYQSWLDGVDPDEVSKEDIINIADHITQDFNQICPAVVVDSTRRGFSTIMHDNGIIFYDIDRTADAANTYGIDNIVGSVAHEIGHSITQKVFEGTGIEITRIQHEMCADYLAGISMGLAGISPEAKYEFLKDYNKESMNYPSTENRIEIIQKGYEFAANPIHNILSPVLFPDLDFVRSVLIENVLNVY